MPARAPQIIVAWSGARLPPIRDLLAKGRLPALAARLAGRERLNPLAAPASSPFALAVTAATGLSPADHGLLDAVIPDTANAAWRLVSATDWPAPPLWDQFAASGDSTAVIGWPATHGAPTHPLRPLASEFDLLGAASPPPPFPDLQSVRPDELDPALLAFFLPAAACASLHPNDPLASDLFRHLARIYSAHNSAIALLSRPQNAPAHLAVFYPVPAFAPEVLRKHPRLPEAALRLLDLLLADLLGHRAEASLHLLGLAPRQAFLVSALSPAPARLVDFAPRLLASLGLSSATSSTLRPPLVPSPATTDTDTRLLAFARAARLLETAPSSRTPTARDRLIRDAHRSELLLEEDRLHEALPALAQAFFAYPENPLRALPLFHCLRRLGLAEEAKEPEAALREHADTGPLARLVEAEVSLRLLGDPSRALALADTLHAHPRHGSDASALRTEALLHLRRFAEARAALEDENAPPLGAADRQAGIAFACFHLGDFPAAAAAARQAVALGSRRPQPSLILEQLEGGATSAKTGPALPAWNLLLAQADARDVLRSDYAAWRGAFLDARSARRGETVVLCSGSDWRVRPFNEGDGDHERLPAELRAVLHRRHTPSRQTWVLVSGELERIVGVASLAALEPGRGRIDHGVTHAWRARAEAIAALLKIAAACATERSLDQLAAQASLGSAGAEWLATHGFTVRRTQELWRIPVAVNLARRLSGMERALARRPLPLRPLDTEALPAVRKICAAHGLLDETRVALAEESPGGFDPRLSFYSGDARVPTAVVLGRFVDGQAYLEVLARAPGASTGGVEITLLLHAFSRAALALGAAEFLCTFDPETARGTARLLSHLDAVRLDRVALFHRPRACPSGLGHWTLGLSSMSAPALVHRPLGQRIPDRLHAVSCSLPTMRDVIGYEEKDPAVTAHLTSGYPRFVVHPLLKQVAETLRRSDPVLAGRELWLCAGPAAAQALRAHIGDLGETIALTPELTALVLPAGADADLSNRARRYLQHTGAFGSSRAAEDWLVATGELAAVAPEEEFAGSGAADPGSDEADAEAAAKIRATLASWFGHGLAPSDIHLTTSGMSATYAAFQAVNAVQAPRGRTRWVQLGWLYLDTIAILQKLTAASTEDYLHHADVFDLAGLEKLFAAHAGKIAGVFAEVPTNPLIQTPALPALAALCRAHGVALVVDPTIASALNIDVLPHADLVANSLTKYAASEGDVILGAVLANPASPLAAELRPALARTAPLAAVFPRDVARLAGQIDATPALIAQINETAPRVVEFLRAHPKVAEVHWSGQAKSAANYAALARTPASVGSMISFVLRAAVPLASFYDRLRIAKGPSFGLETSLICPFMFLAHYDLVTTPEGRACLEKNGISPNLLRLSVGAEPADDLIAALAEALA